MDINLNAPINHLGYGVTGFNILKALAEKGHGVGLFPIGKPEWVAEKDYRGLINEATNNARFYNRDAPSIKIWHQFDLATFPGDHERIAWPIFELTRFTDVERHHLSNVDKLLVCSEWAKGVIEKNGITTPTYVVPLGVDPEVFFYDENEEQNRPSWAKKPTIFMNCGKWEIRKGHDYLLEAFNLAFKPGDDVELWMICDNDFLKHNGGNEVWRKKYANSPMGPHIKFFDKFERQEHMRRVFHHIDCGVFPTRAEGWNLEPLEMMACGRNVILTDYSGQTEYMTDDNCMKLPVEDLETANDGIWFNGQGEWAKLPSVDFLASLLDTTHQAKQSGLLSLNRAGIETAQRFTWHHSVDRLMASIDEVESVGDLEAFRKSVEAMA